MKEEFKEIELYGRMYKVSNYGRIIGARGELKQRLNRDGYCEVTVGADDNRNSIRVHRIVAKLFVEGETKDRNEVNHIDMNRANPRADNLEWVTHQENVKHSHKQGAYREIGRGTKNPKCKLTEDEVCKIREKFNQGKTQKELVLEFGVSRSTIYSIVNNLTWKHLL